MLLICELRLQLGGNKPRIWSAKSQPSDRQFRREALSSVPLGFFLVEGFIFWSGGFDEEEAKVLFDPGTGEGFFEDGGLENLQAGEIIFAVDVVDVFFAGLDFGGAVEARIEEGQEGNRDAGEANQAGAHAEVIFGAAKDVAAH
jgi:hypothetical protein